MVYKLFQSLIKGYATLATFGSVVIPKILTYSNYTCVGGLMAMIAAFQAVYPGSNGIKFIRFVHEIPGRRISLMI